jgi:superfamily I DNA/RNA helicase
MVIKRFTGRRFGGYKSQKPMDNKIPLTRLEGSDQQKDFWEQLVGGENHLMIYAMAGTGKTTTLMQGLLRLDEMDKSGELKDSTILLAYNKAIAEELQKRVPDWAKASTMHALMYAVCRQAIGYRKPNKWKLDDLCDAYFPGPEEGEEGCDVWWMVKNAAKKLVSLAKGHLTGLVIENGKTIAASPPTKADFQAFVEKFNIDVVDQPDVVLKLASDLFAISNEDHTRMDFDDMIYWPVRFNWPMGHYKLVMVDEGQDLNANQQEIIARLVRPKGTTLVEINRAKNRWGRIALVGDPNQAIYGFRGADCQSMDTMAKRLVNFTEEEGLGRNVVRLPLTMTRRCPKSHVERAKAWVGPRLADFEAMPEAPMGEIESKLLPQILEDAIPGQMIISRMNAPLCLVAFKLLKAGVPVKIQGNDFGGELIALVNRLAIYGVKKNKRKKGEKLTKEDFKAKRERAKALSLVEFNSILQEYHEIELAKVMKSRNPSMRAEILEDKVTCIQLLGDGLVTVGNLVDRISDLFKEVGDGDVPREFVLLSSVHRAKGLEADTVVILQPWMMPHPKARQDWEVEQERCIQVVASTRSKRLMVWERSSC